MYVECQNLRHHSVPHQYKFYCVVSVLFPVNQLQTNLPSRLV